MLPSPSKSVLSCTEGFSCVFWAPLAVQVIEGSPTDASVLLTSK